MTDNDYITGLRKIIAARQAAATPPVDGGMNALDDIRRAEMVAAANRRTRDQSELIQGALVYHALDEADPDLAYIPTPEPGPSRAQLAEGWA